MSKTFRTTVVLDYVVADDTDEDVFHDELRDHLEGNEFLDFALMTPSADGDPTCTVETVRDINVEVLDD